MQADATNHLIAQRRLRDTLEGNLFPYLILAPAIIVLFTVGIIPFAYLVFISFQETTFATTVGFAGLTNYASIVGNAAFWSSLGTTALILLVAVPLQLLLGLGIALVIHRGILGSRIIAPVLLLPAVVAPAIVAIIWKVMLAGSWGFVSYTIIEPLELVPGGSVFGTPRTALIGIIFIDVWQWTPFVALALFAGLQALPVAPFRAATVDGASRLHILRYLTLPMLFPLIAVLLLLRTLDTFRIFDTIFVLTGGGPGNATQTVSVFLYKHVFQFWLLGDAAAGAVLIFFGFLIIISILYKFLTRRLNIF